MAISITVAEVKRKAAIADSDTSRDAAITALIAEMQTPIEYSIADRYLSDTSDSGLQAALKLGILEIIAGEFLEQMRRELGASEEFSIAGVSVGAAAGRGLELVQQGASRLQPYLKSALPMMSDTACSNSAADVEPTFAKDEEVW